MKKIQLNVDEFYDLKDDKFSKNENYKNLIYIYLESFDNKYFNEDVFPDLLPKLKNLKKNAFSAEDVYMPWGTGWTIAGMVASQCGIPLQVSGRSGNSLGKLNEFLPNAECMGDVLKRSGFQNHFFGGADLDFAGKGDFYKNHGFDDVYGLAELTDRSKEKSSWGIYDDDLFKIIKEDFHLIKSKSPYSLFMLNVDTHHPEGIVSPSCKDKFYKDGGIKVLNAVHCTDAMVSELIEFFRAKDPDAIIVVASDHLAMPNDAKKLLEGDDRRNTFMVLGTGINPEVFSEKMTTFDAGATVLGFLGFDVPGLGWGRNVNNSSSLLSEYKNINYFNSAVSNMKDFHFSFQGDNAFNGFLYAGGVARFSGRELTPPISVGVGKTGEINNLFINERGLVINEVLENYESLDENVILIDECKFFGKLSERRNYKNGFCYIVSTKEAGGIFGYADNGVEVDLNFKVSSDNKFYFSLLESIDSIKYGEAVVETIKSNHFFDKKIEVDVSAGFLSPSYFFYDGEKYNLSRGLTFYYANFFGQIKKIEHKDFCSENESSEVGVELNKILNDEGFFSGNLFYFVDDSAFCDQIKFDEYASRLPFQLKDLAFREPAFGRFRNANEEFFRGNGKERIVLK
ncbi:sulfatase-like hydrolase/transferase [Comamonas sp. Y33R10-2]|uniref:sulfatase-like hydrolase/transferase n=1 Tax=Comamonas sp. Y33R10-2 TaxID=2853257 RepID=UPI001C5CA9DA|nr:sulfatase-like hydrolase/transferase [Comamonas sp. Y33R10-2]QXZ09348.1 sulfatase-like hydrolase/transferase [Comamonas sp. Y33R10-2]